MFLTNKSLIVGILHMPSQLRLGRIRMVRTLLTDVRLLSTMFAELMHSQVTLPSERLVAVRLVALVLQLLRVFVLEMQHESLPIRSPLLLYLLRLKLLLAARTLLELPILIMRQPVFGESVRRQEHLLTPRERARVLASPRLCP